uniref:SAXO downstream of blistered n=1 Tax=Kallima inachus TaxID=311037 RepID=A0A897Q0L2_KALIN|nr:SAXO downstream of blistered [Kallima inachus]
MTIKNKKTKQSSTSEVTSSKSASSSVQKSSTSTSVQKSSNTLQKVSSSGKKVRYIDVKVEEDDPLMITDISDHASISGSTISEHYNSHPHYIITEAPSVSDLSQIRSHEHNVSDMAQSTTGEFVSSSVLQESSTSHQQSSKSETYQTSSTSVQHSGSSHSQTFDRTMDSSVDNQTLNTAFIDNTAHNTRGSSNTFLSRSSGANATESLIQSERQNLINTQTNQQSSTLQEQMRIQGTTKIPGTSSGVPKNINIRENERSNVIDPSRRIETVGSDRSNFYGGEGSIDKNVRTKEFSNTSHSNESKSSNVTKSSSSSYVVEIVDGKERIIDSSKREWGDAQEHATKEDYASVSGTGIKTETAYGIQNYDMKSKYDTGKDGSKPTSEMTMRENSKFVKDGNQITNYESIISQKDNSLQQQHTSRQEQITSRDSTQEQVTSRDNIKTTSSDLDSRRMDRNVVESVTTENNNVNSQTISNIRRNVNQTDSSNFYGYDSTIQNQLKKVGNILQVADTENLNYSTKILKSNTSSAQQESTSSYVLEVIDGKQRVVDSSHREWGDSKERSTYEKSHQISGTDIKPEHENSRHVLDKESYYDTGKDGIPKSGNYVTEESALYKNGKEIASTSNTYGGDFRKKPAITEHPTDKEDVQRKGITTTSTQKDISSDDYVTSSDTQSYIQDIRDVTETTDFITKEKQNLRKETNSTSTSQTKDTLTTYERSTGAWNGKFIYETDDDRPKRPKQMSPFGRPEQPKHHLKRQDTEENIILSSRDIKDFTSISDLRKIIETSQTNKDVTVSNKNIVIKRNIDDRVLKEIIETVKKYPFKRIDKVSFGTNINEDVKDLYEGIDSEQSTIVHTTTGDTVKKSFEVEKTKSQIEVTRYITENGVTRKITTYEDAKEDEKIKTDVFVDNSSLDIKNLKDVRTTKDIREYDVVDRAITDTTREDTVVSTIYDETIIDDRKTVRDDRKVVKENVYIDETRPRQGGPRKPEKIVEKEQCICEICTCGRHRCPHNDVPEPLFDVEHTTSVVSAYKQDYDEKHVSRTTAVYQEDHLKLEGEFQEPERPRWQPVERPKPTKPEDNLKPEGDFERRKPDEWRPGDRAPIRRPEDNLKPEGEFSTPEKEPWRPAERQRPKKPEDNLRPEGDFEKRKPDEWRPGDRAPVRRPEDNLKPEGDFEDRRPDKWQPGDRAPVKRPEDNLKPEGDFEKRRPEEWRPGDRAPVRRPEDNLRPEGDFTTPEKEPWRPAERQKAKKPEDNLRLEGDFEKRKPEEWRPGDRAPVRRPEDNLKPEGDFEDRRPEVWRPGDRAPVKRPEDNLRPEGEFSTPDKQPWQPAERQRPKKPEDNLRPEGDFEKRKPDEWRPGDRAPVRRPEDNLKPEGDFEDRRPEQWRPGDRAPVRRPEDNLRPEGEFEKRQPEHWRPGDRAPTRRPEDNLKPEGEFSTPEKEPWRPAERQRPKKPEDNLRPEGDFEKRKPDEWRPGDRAPVRRPEDNLKPEGDFEDRRPDKWQPGDRAPVKRPEDNLKPEGDFEKRRSEEWRPGDRAPVRRPEDNLRPEGDFTTPEKEPWRPAERQKAKKPEDNLKPEGDFEKRKPQEWQPGDRAPVRRPEDNLKPEGEFTTPKKEEWKPAERPQQKKPVDNLKPEGEFTKRQPGEFKPAEKPLVKKPQDNLRPEGDFTTSRTITEDYKVVTGERADIIRRTDNIITEGEFTDSTTTRTEYTLKPVERQKPVRRNTWTKIEGDMITETTSHSEYIDYTDTVERTTSIKRKTDNLIHEGEIDFVTSNQQDYTEKNTIIERPQRRRTWTKEDFDKFYSTEDIETHTTTQEEYRIYEEKSPKRPERKPEDNLRPEGEFLTPDKEKWSPAERPIQKKPKDNLKLEGDFEQPRHEDHLKMEGIIDVRRTRDDYKRIDKTEKVIIQKHEDNLRTEGEFIDLCIRNDYNATKGERASVVKPQDNLKPDGKFYKPEVVPSQPAEKRKPFKHVDNITIERDTDIRRKQKIERVDIIRREDNLKIEGEFIDMKQRNDYKVVTGDKSTIVKHEDNLKMEGKMENIRSSDTYRVVKGQRVKLTRREDNLKIEGVFEDLTRRDDYNINKDMKSAITYYTDEKKTKDFENKIVDDSYTNGQSDVTKIYEEKRDRRTPTFKDKPKPVEDDTIRYPSQRPSEHKRPIQGSVPDKVPEEQVNRAPQFSKSQVSPVDKIGDTSRPKWDEHKGNLYPSEKSEVKPDDRKVSPEDKVRSEFDQPRRPQQTYERASPIRPKDNLYSEGDLSDYSPSPVKTGGNIRPDILRQDDTNKLQRQLSPEKDQQIRQVVYGDDQRYYSTTRTDSSKLSDETTHSHHAVKSHVTKTISNIQDVSYAQKTHSETHSKKLTDEDNTTIDKTQHVKFGSDIHDSQLNQTREKLQKDICTSSSKKINRTSQDTINRDETDHSTSRHSMERHVVNKTDSKNIKNVSSSTNKIMKQITEKKLIAGKWVTVTKNVEVKTISDGDTKSPNTRTYSDGRTEARNKQTSSTMGSIISSEQANINDSNSHIQRNVLNTTHVVKGRTDDNNGRLVDHSVSDNHLTKTTGHQSSQKLISSEQYSSSSSNQATTNQTQFHSHVSSDFHSKESKYNTNQSKGINQVDKNISFTKQACDRQVQNIGSGDSIQRKYPNDHSSISQTISNQDNRNYHSTHSSDRHVQRTTGTATNISTTNHVEHNISKASSSHQSHTINRNQLSDSVTKTSIEFQRAMHGGGDVPISSVEKTSRSGHHKRTSDLVSDMASTNAVLHRKGVTSTTEAQHSISSTAAAQRKSITNLNERGEYISNSTQSADRKSISSMHRSARDNVAVISQHTENVDIRRQQKRDGQSTMVVERQPRVVIRDNLRVGGEFYGQSEARSYGSFSRSNQIDKSEKNERVEKVERHVRHGTSSHFVLGDSGTSYKREYTAHVHGTCPATLIESPRTPFKHSRDSREHKFYTSKITQKTPQ